ncbi:PEP-CTERM sorting domain-containing protein [Verrucomicrobiaceae bacterium N1E253]|uniref:PEP-CTERM sorting domain-containing protein n=1 Tax=Oceaniferula marina TaxID=2748318 RepID=A0A851GFK7_9BACT|nr:PEP-CTERM sorting domain-containing protein [Oceaniferula marina]NWK56548.1 PEP-CTERM sorting domain-containing protein [Oceaniferula marina]
MKFKTPIITLTSVAALTISSQAATIFSEDFTGDSATNLQGTTTTEGGLTWNADALFKANGSYNGAGNADKSGYINLGAGPTINTTYTLTTSMTTVGDLQWFFGLADSAADTSLRVQDGNVDNAVLLMYRGVGSSDGVRLDFVDSKSQNASVIAQSNGHPANTLSMVVTSNNLTDASIEMFKDGASLGTVNRDITGYQYFVLGAEAGSGSGQINSISLTAVPEPSSTALLGLSGLSLILRRKK